MINKTGNSGFAYYAIDPEGTGTGGVTLAAQGGSTANPPAPSRAIVLGINTPSTREFTFGINLKL